MAANLVDKRQRVHNHYLKSSVFCGSRYIITNAKNRYGVTQENVKVCDLGVRSGGTCSVCGLWTWWWPSAWDDQGSYATIVIRMKATVVSVACPVFVRAGRC
ncbi:MAG: hypothetical protein M3443_02760 [Actinomycetota bacterium]|nr:hypothetical protein [Actinomycetota bacterium]